MEPADDSGLAILDLRFAGKRRAGSVQASVESTGGEPTSEFLWNLPHWIGPGHLRAAVRLPSGKEYCVRVAARVQPNKGAAPFRAAPFLLTLAARQVHEHTGLIQRCGRVLVMVRRLPSGLASSALAVRFSHGGHVEEWSSWERGKDKQGLRIYRVSATVAAGPCSVQLLLKGRPLSWSRVVNVLPGKKHYVHLADVEKLK